MTEKVDPDHLPEGTLVDGWRVVRRLDGGAYGTVYQVEKAGSFFALKMARYREQSRDERHTDERAQRELSCLLSLRHPHIARVWGHGRWPHPTEGFFYLVMGYVEGFTLAGWMEHTRATAHELVVLIDKVFAAVAHMHAQGIFHRDLKPGNIMVSASPHEPVVVDYGAAHFPVAPGPQLTDTRLPPGTPRYTSPEAEHFEAEHRHDRSARYEFKVADELYALGVILYDLLTDPRPESHPQPQPLGGWSIVPAHEVNERVPVALSRFVAKLLERDPAKRPVSVEAARRDVAELVPLQAEEWTKRPLQPLPPQAPAEPGRARSAPAASAQKAPHAKPFGRWPGARTLALVALGLGVLLACGAYLGLRGGTPARSEPPAPGAGEAPLRPSLTPTTSEELPADAPASSPLASQPTPQPSPSQPVSTQEKGTLVNTRQAPEAAVPPPCSQTKAPPRGTPQWRAWCECVSVVGTLAAFQAGCAGAQVKQSPTAECSDESIQAMKLLGLHDNAEIRVEYDVNHPCSGSHEECCAIDMANPLCAAQFPLTVTSRVTQGYGDLVPGTLLAGYFILKGVGVFQRWTEATLPDGRKHPVCIHAVTNWWENRETCFTGLNMCSAGYAEARWQWPR